jgi:hypothetical protein
VLIITSLLVASPAVAQQTDATCDLTVVAAALDDARAVIDSGDQDAALAVLSELESLIASTRAECEALALSEEAEETLPPALLNDKLLHDTSLITGEPCSAPCWRGITPGKTGWREALTILENQSDLILDPVQDAPDSDAIGVQWKEADGELCCLMISEDGETITAISLQLAPDITVGEVFEVHDEPSYALGGEITEDQAIVNLIYPDRPMIVVAFVAGKTGELMESSEVIAVSYLNPTDMQLVIQTSNLHAWEGYQPFSVYTADAEEDFEVTPSITLTSQSRRFNAPVGRGMFTGLAMLLE